MKRFIIPFLLVVAIGAGFFYFRVLHRTKAPANTLLLSGNVEAHESVVAFPDAWQNRGAAGGRRPNCNRRRPAGAP